MNRMKLTEIAGLSMGAICLILTAVVALELMTPAGPSRGASMSAEPVVPERLEVTHYRPAPLDQYAEILARPLFFADRQLPALPQAATEEAPPTEPLRLSLEGVAIVNDSRVALLRDERGNELIQLSEGMSHNGWVLEVVAPSTAAFRRGAETERLELAASAENQRRRFRR